MRGWREIFGIHWLARGGLLPDAGLARSSGICDVTVGHSYAHSGFSSPMGSARANRALDNAHLALRLYHRSARVLNALQMVPSPRPLSRCIERCPKRRSRRPDANPGSAKLSKSCVTTRFDVSSHRCAAAHGGDFMVTIATFNDPAKARQLKRRFQDAGLKADVHNEAPLQEFGFMSKPQANAKVMVDDNDFEKAQSLMIEWEATDPDISAALVRCPQCNSSNIEYPADDTEVFDACSRRRALRAQNNSKRILLPGLSLYLDKPGRTHHWAALASVFPGERGRTRLTIPRQRVADSVAAADIPLPSVRCHSERSEKSQMICFKSVLVQRWKEINPRCFAPAQHDMLRTK